MKTNEELDDLFAIDPFAVRDYALELQRDLAQTIEQRDTALRAAQARRRLDGATDAGDPAAYPADAAQFAARWNAKTTEERDEWVTRHVDSAEVAVACRIEDHRGELKALRERNTEIELRERDNHHNARMCPYCTPDPAQREQPVEIPTAAQQTALGCECNPREATLDEDMNVVCAECGAMIEKADGR